MLKEQMRRIGEDSLCKAEARCASPFHSSRALADFQKVALLLCLASDVTCHHIAEGPMPTWENGVQRGILTQDL
eukprot:1696393-Amphidinium_carterae.1